MSRLSRHVAAPHSTFSIVLDAHLSCFRILYCVILHLECRLSRSSRWPGPSASRRHPDEVAAEELWVTHGREEALVYFANKKGYRARALALTGFEEDE